METLLKNQDSGLPLGKITLYVIVAFIVVGAGVQWLLGFQRDQAADELYARAKDHFENSRLEAGLIAIDRALKRRETSKYLTVKLDILMNQNKPYEAQLILDKLVSLEPKNAHFQSMSGRIWYNQGEMDKAVERYQNAVELAPDNVQYQVELANLFFHQGKEAEAATLFNQLIQQDPNYKLAWNQYITALINREDYAPTEKLALKAVGRFSSDSDFHFLLATLYDRMGKKSEAVSAYYRSLELEPMEDSIAANRIFEMTGKRVPLRLEKMDSDQIAFDKQGKVMFVSGRVNREPGRFLLDTGASVCVIYQSRMARYGIVPGPFKIEAETANGMVQAQVGYATVQMGQNQEDAVLFAILPDPQSQNADGIIGMNFLEKFRFEIDQNSRKLTLKR